MTVFRLGRRSLLVGGMSAGLLPLLSTGPVARAASVAVEEEGFLTLDHLRFLSASLGRPRLRWKRRGRVRL